MLVKHLWMLVLMKNKNFGRQISATVSMKLTHNKDRFKLQIFYKKKLLKKKNLNIRHSRNKHYSYWTDPH